MSNEEKPIHEIDDHLSVPCACGRPCQHIGFRVVDAEKFEAWLWMKMNGE